MALILARLLLLWFMLILFICNLDDDDDDDDDVEEEEGGENTDKDKAVAVPAAQSCSDTSNATIILPFK